MQIQDQVRIQGQTDNASVIKNKNGTIYIGGITLQSEEVADSTEPTP